MKKNYFTLLIAIFLVGFTNAQTTIFDSTFDEASYDAEDVNTNLNNHADWTAGHFGNANSWRANGDSDLIQVGANFSYSSLTSTTSAITGADGDVITVKTIVQLGNNPQIFATTGSINNLILLGLLPDNTPENSNDNKEAGQKREGVLIQADPADGGKLRLTNAGSSGPFTGAEISQADKAAYEVIVEYTIGASADESSKTVRITNVSSGESSVSSKSNKLRGEIYTAITGAGAYYFNWALNFYQKEDSTINAIYVNSLTITKNDAVLSTPTFNNFEFSMSPNPANNLLNINSKETLNKVEIFNLLGKKVLSTTNTKSIDVSSLTKSVYLVKISSDKGISTKKLVKN